LKEEAWRFNESFLFGILKVIWDNLGYPSSKYFSTLVARDFLDFLKKKISLDNMSVEEALNSVTKFFVDSGIAKAISVEMRKNDVIVNVEGCIYNSVDSKLANQVKAPIFVCPLVNVLMGIVEHKTDLMGEFGPVEIKDSKCNLIFDLYPKKTKIHV